MADEIKIYFNEIGGASLTNGDAIRETRGALSDMGRWYLRYI